MLLLILTPLSSMTLDSFLRLVTQYLFGFLKHLKTRSEQNWNDAVSCNLIINFKQRVSLIMLYNFVHWSTSNAVSSFLTCFTSMYFWYSLQPEKGQTWTELLHHSYHQNKKFFLTIYTVPEHNKCKCNPEPVKYLEADFSCLGMMKSELQTIFLKQILYLVTV